MKNVENPLLMTIARSARVVGHRSRGQRRNEPDPMVAAAIYAATRTKRYGLRCGADDAPKRARRGRAGGERTAAFDGGAKEKVPGAKKARAAAAFGAPAARTTLNRGYAAAGLLRFGRPANHVPDTVIDGVDFAGAPRRPQRFLN